MSHEWILSREQSRAIDRLAVEKFGIPSIVLMENAGRSCADALLELGVSVDSPVCLCCGKGNNGGDGFVMARHLAAREVPVEVLTFEDPRSFSADARLNWEILTKSEVPYHHLSMPNDRQALMRHLKHASWVVDALLGTGASGRLRAPYDDVVAAINESGRPVLAIDVPSGLDCNLGKEMDEVVLATATVTMVAPKPGFQSKQGIKHCGKVLTGSIGIPRNLIYEVHRSGEFEESN